MQAVIHKVLHSVEALLFVSKYKSYNLYRCLKTYG